MLITLDVLANLVKAVENSHADCFLKDCDLCDALTNAYAVLHTSVEQEYYFEKYFVTGNRVAVQLSDSSLYDELGTVASRVPDDGGLTRYVIVLDNGTTIKPMCTRMYLVKDEKL